MGVIRQLKNFFTGKVIYPKTLTKAVYDENGERLDKILRDTMLATDSEEYSGVEPRDADTLGGRYSAEDISAIKDNLTEVNNSLVELKNNHFSKDYVGVSVPYTATNRCLIQINSTSSGYNCTINGIDFVDSNATGIFTFILEKGDVLNSTKNTGVYKRELISKN